MYKTTKTNIFDVTANNFEKFCVFLMGPPQEKKEWTRFGWKGGNPNDLRGAVTVNFAKRRWADHSQRPAKVDSIDRNYGLIEFVTHIKRCTPREATLIIKEFVEVECKAHG